MAYILEKIQWNLVEHYILTAIKLKMNLIINNLSWYKKMKLQLLKTYINSNPDNELLSEQRLLSIIFKFGSSNKIR